MERRVQHQVAVEESANYGISDFARCWGGVDVVHHVRLPNREIRRGAAFVRLPGANASSFIALGPAWPAQKQPTEPTDRFADQRPVR